MIRLCLDTSAYSQFKRGHLDAVARITGAHEVLVPVIALGELRTGFRTGSKERENEEALQVFLGQPLVRVLEVDDEASSIYAELAADLRAKGTPLPSNDIWIGALAAREAATVLTYDAHFLSMRRVSAEVLEP